MFDLTEVNSACFIVADLPETCVGELRRGSFLWSVTASTTSW